MDARHERAEALPLRLPPPAPIEEEAVNALQAARHRSTTDATPRELTGPFPGRGIWPEPLGKRWSFS